MDTIWCHPFSIWLFLTTKDLWWKVFFSQPQLAPGHSKLVNICWRQAEDVPSLNCFLQAGSLRSCSLYLWKSVPTGFLPLASPVLCTFLSCQSWESLENILSFLNAEGCALELCVTVPKTITSPCRRTRLSQAWVLVFAHSSEPGKKTAGRDQSEISHREAIFRDGTISRGKMKDLSCSSIFFLNGGLTGFSAGL